MTSLYHRILGSPFVYEQVRPRVVGGIDMGPLYRRLHGGAERVVLDVGCGTGDALRYLEGFERYVGVDTDPVAISFAKKRAAGRPNVTFESRFLEDADVREIAPTGVVLSGVLHHCSNDEAVRILSLAASSPNLVRLVTSDIVFLPGAFFNNVMASLDRGRFCRTPDGYAELVRRAGLVVEEFAIERSHPSSDRVQYFMMTARKATEKASSA